MRNIAIVKDISSVSEALVKINEQSKVSVAPNMALVVNKNNEVINVITEGDIRRLLVNNYSLSGSIGVILNKKFLFLKRDHNQSDIDILLNKTSSNNVVVPILDDNNALYELKILTKSKKSIAIYGLGFVGLTLAAVLSNKGYLVKGLDINERLIDDLNNDVFHVHEPNLKEYVSKALSSESLTFTSDKNDLVDIDFHIISVGTPVNESGEVNKKALETVCINIAKDLKKQSHIMLRSTVPVGTSRNYVIPLIEKISGFKCGKDFYLTFAPERTVEGNAINELLEIPQVIGSYCDSGAKEANEFWMNSTSNMVNLESLESAEMVKLANNSYRDLSFAFANHLALLAQDFNCNAFDVINAANNGYPRNKIPLPSPGVGGYCLTKDPYLFQASFKNKNHPLCVTGRNVNKSIVNRIVNEIENYIVSDKNMKILIIGMAFKGYPETNDLRGSCSLDIYKAFIDKNIDTCGYDFVLSKNDLENNNINNINDLDEIKDFDIVMLLNNHKENKNINFSKMKKGSLLYDGWNQIDNNTLSDIKYATIGKFY